MSDNNDDTEFKFDPSDVSPEDIADDESSDVSVKQRQPVDTSTFYRAIVSAPATLAITSPNAITSAMVSLFGTGLFATAVATVLTVLGYYIVIAAGAVVLFASLDAVYTGITQVKFGMFLVPLLIAGFGYGAYTVGTLIVSGLPVLTTLVIGVVAVMAVVNVAVAAFNAFVA